MALSISDVLYGELGGLGYTGSISDMQLGLLTDPSPPGGGSVAAADITDATATGIALITAANAAAGRSTLSAITQTEADARVTAVVLADDVPTNHTAAFTLALTDTVVHTCAPASSFSVTMPATTVPGHRFKFIKTDTDTTKTVTLTGTFNPGAVANFVLRGLGQWVEFETTSVSGTFQVVAAGPCVVPTGTAHAGLTDGIPFIEYTP